MNIRGRTGCFVPIVGGLMLITHLALKILGRSVTSDILGSIIDTAVYVNDISLFLIWGSSIFWRVVRDHIRRALFAVVGIETFWLAIRTVKYAFFHDSALLGRYAWYLYYLPMLMLPAMCLKLAIYLGKRSARSPKWVTVLFPALSSLLFLLVITNDLHSLVFEIPPGIDGLSAGNYGYGIGFFGIMLYIGICTVSALVLMYRSCRRLRGKFSGILPILPYLYMVAIGILNMLGVPHIDITLTICVSVSASLEACLQTGIIQTNRGYINILHNSSIGLEIVGSNLTPLITSDAFIPISDEQRREVMEHPVMIADNIRVSSAPMTRGYVLWQDDLSELTETVRKIALANEILQGRNDALRAEYTSAKREHQLKEKNRLYNMLFDQSECYIRRYEELTEQLAAETNPSAFTKLSVRIAYVSAFIKRRLNMIFLDEENKEIGCRELELCIGESLRILSLNGIECSCSSVLSEPLSFGTITSLYERFYNLTAELTDTISSLDVELREVNGTAVITLVMRYKSDTTDEKRTVTIR